MHSSRLKRASLLTFACRFAFFKCRPVLGNREFVRLLLLVPVSIEILILVHTSFFKTTMYHTLYLAGRAHASDFQEANHIPPILSCGSTSSMGSGTTHQTDRPMSFDKKKFTSSSAKELPVWLVGTFLLLHCEEMAFLRNLSGQDERRFYGSSSSSTSEGALLTNGNRVDFSSLLKNPSLSPRYEQKNRQLFQSILFATHA